jgi:hypothetical protein
MSKFEQIREAYRELGYEEQLGDKTVHILLKNKKLELFDVSNFSAISVPFIPPVVFELNKGLETIIMPLHYLTEEFIEKTTGFSEKMVFGFTVDFAVELGDEYEYKFDLNSEMLAKFTSVRKAAFWSEEKEEDYVYVFKVPEGCIRRDVDVEFEKAISQIAEVLRMEMVKPEYGVVHKQIEKLRKEYFKRGYKYAKIMSKYVIQNTLARLMNERIILWNPADTDSTEVPFIPPIVFEMNKRVRVIRMPLHYLTEDFIENTPEIPDHVTFELTVDYKVVAPGVFEFDNIIDKNLDMLSKFKQLKKVKFYIEGAPQKSVTMYGDANKDLIEAISGLPNMKLLNYD